MEMPTTNELVQKKVEEIQQYGEPDDDWGVVNNWEIGTGFN